MIAFPQLGGLDSGGARSDLEYVDMYINQAKMNGAEIIIKDYDIEYEKFERFLLLNANSFYNHLEPSLEINQYRLPEPTGFGEEFDEGWMGFVNEFYQRNFRNALGCIRALVQDAMKIASEKKGLNIKNIDKPNVNNLTAKLINEGLLDGRFQEWAKAFTAFANLGGHSKIEPTNEELSNPIIRKRVVLTIFLGIQLIEEIEKVL